MCINQYKQHSFYCSLVLHIPHEYAAMELLAMPWNCCLCQGMQGGFWWGMFVELAVCTWLGISLQSLDDTITFNSNLLSLTSKGAIHQTYLKPVPSKQWSTITLHILQGMFTNVCTIPHLHIQFTKNSDVLWHIGLQQYGTLHHRYWGNTVSFTFLEIRLTAAPL